MTTKIDNETATDLAALIHRLRQAARYPTWDVPGISRFVMAAADRGDVFEIAAAAIRCASVATNRTPAVIAHDGPHWRPAAGSSSAAVPPPYRPPEGDAIPIRTKVYERGAAAARSQLPKHLAVECRGGKHRSCPGCDCHCHEEDA